LACVLIISDCDYGRDRVAPVPAPTAPATSGLPLGLVIRRHLIDSFIKRVQCLPMPRAAAHAPVFFRFQAHLRREHASRARLILERGVFPRLPPLLPLDDLKLGKQAHVEWVALPLARISGVDLQGLVVAALAAHASASAAAFARALGELAQ